jgi:hypothetical protein
VIVFVYFLVPETKQIAIEEIDVIFGGSNHVEKGGQIMGLADVYHAENGVNDTTAAQGTTDVERTAAAGPKSEHKQTV